MVTKIGMETTEYLRKGGMLGSFMRLAFDSQIFYTSCDEIMEVLHPYEFHPAGTDAKAWAVPIAIMSNRPQQSCNSRTTQQSFITA